MYFPGTPDVTQRSRNSKRSQKNKKNRKEILCGRSGNCANASRTKHGCGCTSKQKCDTLQLSRGPEDDDDQDFGYKVWGRYRR